VQLDPHVIVHDPMFTCLINHDAVCVIKQQKKEIKIHCSLIALIRIH